MDAQTICKLAESIDPTVGIAIITREYKVKWANPAHLRRWPDLIGKVCYKHVNGFTRQCDWCPVIKTFKDKKMHNELVCSPKDRDLGWDIVFSNIVSIPVFDGDGEIIEVVEGVFDSTDREKKDLQRRSDRYGAISQFGEILERLKFEEYVPDYLLLAAVWSKGLNVLLADVYVLQETDPDKTPKVKELRSIKREECKEVIQKFEGLLSQDALTGHALSSLKGSLDDIVEHREFTNGNYPRVEEQILERYKNEIKINEAEVANKLDETSPSSRLAPNLVCTRMLGARGGPEYFVVIRTVETGHDLTTDRDLLDVGIYGLIMQRGLRNRGLVKDVDSVVGKAEQFLARVEEDMHALAFAASVVSSFAHDLLISSKRLENQIDYMWVELTKPQRVRMARYKDTAKKEIDFIRGCLSRSIDVARMEKISTKDFRKTDLHELVQEVRNSFRKLFEESGVTFSFSRKASDGSLLCEPILMKQVLSNLIVNACTSLQKATHRVRLITVRTERDSCHFTIIVEDNGRGIDPAIIDQIWRPFFSTKGRGLGTGLGLMICKRIVEDIHDGTITVESKHGYGATFAVSLPIIEE